MYVNLSDETLAAVKSAHVLAEASRRNFPAWPNIVADAFDLIARDLAAAESAAERRFCAHGYVDNDGICTARYAGEDHISQPLRAPSTTTSAYPHYHGTSHPCTLDCRL
jgi:hypothetical protein